jgi:outer membrane protein
MKTESRRRFFTTAATVTAAAAATPVLAGSGSAPAPAQLTIATVNLQKAFDNYYKRDEAQAAFDKARKDLEKEGQSMVEEGKKAMDDFNKLKDAVDDPTITPQERDSRKQKAQAKYEEVRSQEAALRTFDNNAREKLALQKQRMMEMLMKDVQTAVSAIAKKENYNFVIDVSAESATGTLFVLYHDGEHDTTDAVLKQLNAAAPATTNAPSSTPKTAEKPDDKPKK